MKRNVFLHVSGMLEKIFLCVYKVCLKRFFLRVSGMFEKKCCFFCLCQVCLERNVFFLHVSGTLKNEMFFFACVRYV